MWFLAGRVFRSSRCIGSLVRFSHAMAVCDTQYEEAVKLINEMQCNHMLPPGKKYEGLGLTLMRQFLRRVSVTQDDLRSMRIVHVAGTKGKGSTCAFVESLLRHHGIHTGFFSSPHLVEVRERVRLNGKPISRQMFTNYFWEVYELLDKSKDLYDVKFPSYFYFLTTLALYIFKHEKVSAAVVEVGIGGTYDCTNVIDHPVVCGVTSLGIDHTNLLGNTVGSIAWHKAGIFKAGVPAFTVQQPEDGLDVLMQVAQQQSTPLQVVPDWDNYVSKSASTLRLGLSGDYQKLNASLAIQLVHCWLSHVSSKSLPHSTEMLNSLNQTYVNGLAQCHWNGRAQILKYNSITFYLDGAHTMRSIECASKWFSKQAAEEEKDLKKPCIKLLAFNITKKRDAYGMLSILHENKFDQSIFVPNITTLLQSSFNDQTNLTVPVENRLVQVFANRDSWKKVCANEGHMITNAQAPVFPCIADAVLWVSKDRDFKLSETSKELSMEDSWPAFPYQTEHLQILVTGSLHLVGGFLRILKPNLND